MKLSIIVPVYNTGDYIKGCIESIINQTLTDLELILVDDGSKDNSGDICDEYALKDKRIKVIHKHNEGVSVARNIGIANAKGEYIGFVDSDDTIVPEMYERMYISAKNQNAEIVMCDAVTVFSDCHEEPDTINQLSCSRVISKDDWTPTLLKEMAGSSWRCIYSSALIQRHSSQFPVALKFSEDRVFNIYAMGYAEKLYYIKEPYYNRLMHNDSCVHRFHADYFETAKEAAKWTRQALRDAWDDDENYQTSYIDHFVSNSIAAINNYFYKTCPWSFREKYNAVKNICNDKMIEAALRKSNCGGVRGILIARKKFFLLCGYAILVNVKNGR